jgi:dTDP-glucose 4,6-dehydratase
MTIFITGATGFIGANLVLDWLAQSNESVVNLDKLSYAGNLETLVSQNGDARHISVQGDIGDGDYLVRAYHHTYGLPVLATNCARP